MMKKCYIIKIYSKLVNSIIILAINKNWEHFSCINYL